jgi:hypothetical protein
VAVAAIKGEKTLSKLAQQYDVHPNRITAWEAHRFGAASGLFSSGGAAADSSHAIGKLSLENDCSPKPPR